MAEAAVTKTTGTPLTPGLSKFEVTAALREKSLTDAVPQNPEATSVTFTSFLVIQSTEVRNASLLLIISF